MKTPNGVEVHPCAIIGKDESGKEIMEQCEPDDPALACWSVYWHLESGGLECVKDFPTEQEAEEAASLLRDALSVLE